MGYMRRNSLAPVTSFESFDVLNAPLDQCRLAGMDSNLRDIPMMFALSPQAKGRVERTADTFRDRLITGLPLAGATPMETGRGHPPAVPPPVQPAFPGASPVYCACFQYLHPDFHREQVLCFKNRRRVARDKTVRFQKRTLQRPLSRERPGYAGIQVVILEGPGGRLSVQHDGRTKVGQEAPPSPGPLHKAAGTLPTAPVPVLVPARQRLRQAFRNCSAPRLFQKMTNRLGG